MITTPAPLFQFSATTVGSYRCTYVFENEEDFQKWVQNFYPNLVKTYGKLDLHISKLDKLQVGDTCFVAGEGSDEFQIEGWRKLEENRYSYALNTGCWEATHKCFTKWERGSLPNSLKLKCQKLGFKQVLMQDNYICLEK